jgi:hypothetical protein
MKKITSQIIPIIATLTLVGAIMAPGVVHAAGWIDGPILSVFNNGFAIFMNWILQITSVFVFLTGILLSISINITMHIGDIFNGSDALKEIWVLVRNLSSMGIIFLLLFTSIQTIVGIKGSNDVKKLIGNIIMAGLLINFSLFFTGVAIDASNLISLQFYRAIAPQSTTSYTVSAAFTDGGLSNVFMNSLKIPTIYQQKDVLKGTDVFASISIATLGGVVMMITAGFSFLAASIAFMSRTAILLFVMALSPIYFAAMVFPQLEDKSKEIMKHFTTQLLFMPTYLFLMYVALKFIGSDSFSTIFNQNVVSGTGSVGTSSVTPAFIGTIIQYVIALFFINLPLAAAISMGVAGAKMVPNAQKIGGVIGGWFGQHSVGRVSKKLQGSLSSSGFASRNPNVSVLLNRALGSTAGATFGGSKGGYDKRFKEFSKERSDLGKKIGISDAAKKKFVEHGINNWDEKDGQNKAILLEAKNRFKNARTLEDKKSAEKQARELEAEISAMKKAQDENSQIKYLEEKAEKEAKLEFARNLEDPKGKSFIEKAVTLSWVTSKARKDAADAIRKEINKSKTGKLMDMIKEVGSEDKPKDSGGGGGEAKPK